MSSSESSVDGSGPPAQATPSAASSPQSETAIRPGEDGLEPALRALVDAQTPGARIGALAELVRAGLSTEGVPAGAPSPLVARIESDPAARAALARGISAVARETQAIGLLADDGLPNDRGLWEETTDRLARKFLPRPRDEGELARALAHFLPRREHYAELARARAHELAQVIERVHSAGLDTRPLVEAAEEALALLATRIAALGLGEALRVRLDDSAVRASAFHRLVLRTQELLDARKSEDAPAEHDARLERWHTTVEEVRGACEGVHAHLEATGVSLQLVYAIDAISAGLTRMEHLVSVLFARSRPEAAAHAARLWLELVRAKRSDASLRALLRQNLRLLARRVIERAGRTGEHYITTTRAEYFAMLGTAAGGGALTTITAALKLAITAFGGPLFVQGLLASTNYALSFVAIQHLGFTLATKQPSMTAAALAETMRRAGPGSTEELVTHAARIVRSQLAAALSNIVFVSLGAWGLHAAWVALRGAPLLTAEQAEYVLHSLHPWKSLTVFYAALTGVILWMASLIGGAIENWAVYRRLPAAIAEHRLGARFGVERMRKLARFVELNLSGWGVNTSLGFLLGMTSSVGRFFGLPLDVRHVTLSTGMLALALCSMSGEARESTALWPVFLGIGLIFALNLGVSFALALRLALRARDAGWIDQRRFVTALLRRMLRSPLEFVFPPRA